MIRRRRQHRKSGIKGSMVTVGLGLLIVIILGYYLLNKVQEEPADSEPASTEQAD
ncbi:MAG: hypothetical protein WBB45_21375 [Cyclobacteriaceae bacterium]